MTRVYRIKKEFWFLKAGLFVVENVNGDFYISMDDEDVLDCPIHFSGLVIDGSAVRADMEHFELVGSFPDFAAYQKDRKNMKNEFQR